MVGGFLFDAFVKCKSQYSYNKIVYRILFPVSRSPLGQTLAAGFCSTPTFLVHSRTKHHCSHPDMFPPLPVARFVSLTSCFSLRSLHTRGPVAGTGPRYSLHYGMSRGDRYLERFTREDLFHSKTAAFIWLFLKKWFVFWRSKKKLSTEKPNLLNCWSLKAFIISRPVIYERAQWANCVQHINSDSVESFHNFIHATLFVMKGS